MILVTGANGQLGTELRYLLDERGEEYVAVDVAEMDITNAEKVDEVFAQVKPTLVYHCAAYTAVDAAEDEGKELDYAINVTGTEIVAKAAAKYGATLVYISTDYVFDGKNQLVKNGKLMILQILKLNTVVQNVWVKKQLKNMLKTSTSSVLLGYLVTTVKTLSSQCKILPKLMTH
ncbi:dTDP-4-dehydrorhamnose reductase [Streptococcus sp. HSISB1]|nr:dTDP-4-dehydrorhamnose reductase [Streptococcus sp. HSISB1]